MICRNSINGYTAKKIDETIRPYAEKLMDEDGPVIRSLTADAAEEFWGTVFFVRGERPDGSAEMVEEALTRWFPKTYPYNLQDLQRYAEVFPEQEVQVAEATKSIKESLLLDSMKDRIRQQNLNHPGTGMIRAAQGMQSERLNRSPSHRDACEDRAGEASEDQALPVKSPMSEICEVALREMTSTQHWTRKARV